MRKYKGIKKLLKKKGLKNPNFNVLKPDSSLYRTLMFQPLGNVQYGDYFVRNTNNENILKKFISFFDLSVSEKADLSITPEYSCPWRIILHLIKRNVLPEKGKLWVIGCESITPKELKQIVDENNEITWIYEEKLLENEIEDKFLDPVCYFFKTENSSGNLSNVIVVQFKTLQMGGTDFETNGLLRGEVSYILKSNEKNSVSLTTLICSESLNYRVEDLPPNIYLPYLILHIQMNNEPFHANFCNYRKNYYENHFINKEFICLNWARNTLMLDRTFSYGGSAFYTKSDQLNIEDDRINKNHKYGLYYSFWQKAHAHVFFFHYDEFIFEFESTKVSQVDDPIQLRNNTGPRMIKTYKWDILNYWQESGEILDDLPSWCCKSDADPLDIDLFDVDSLDDVFLTFFEDLTPINKERLILLSTGEINSQDWYKPKEMKSLRIGPRDGRNELNTRLLFSQDKDESVNSIREAIFTRFKTLISEIIQKVEFPLCISDLANNCQLYYNPDYTISDPLRKDYGYNYNLYSIDKRNPASVAFVGHVSETSAKQVFDNMKKVFLKDFETDQSSKRVVVWFQHKMEFKHIVEPSPSIRENTSNSPTSIRKGGTINGCREFI